MVLHKDELEIQLKDEHQLIRDGVLKDDSPLDVSEEFQKLCHACRIEDLKGCQEAIAAGVNINARDQFDYTPLILVRLADCLLLFKPLSLPIIRRPACVGTMRLSNCFSNPGLSANEIHFKARDVFTTR